MSFSVTDQQQEEEEESRILHRSCKFLVLYTAGEISKQLELLPELTILCEALTIVGIEGKLKSARANC